MEKTNGSQNQMKAFLAFLVVVLVGVVAYLVYNNTLGDVKTVVTDTDNTNTNSDNNDQDADKVSDTTGDKTSDNTSEVANDEATNDSLNKSNTDSETGDNKSVIPSGWVAIENKTYNYIAYKPSNYYYRAFGIESVLGIDPNKIPEASSYTGVISIQALDGSLESAKNDYIQSFMAIAQDTKTTENGTWDLIIAEIPESDMQSAQNVMCAFIEVSGQVFVVDYRYDSSSDATYETIFDQFYPSIKFNK